MFTWKVNTHKIACNTRGAPSSSETRSQCTSAEECSSSNVHWGSDLKSVSIRMNLCVKTANCTTEYPFTAFYQQKFKIVSTTRRSQLCRDKVLCNSSDKIILSHKIRRQSTNCMLCITERWEGYR